MQCRVLVFILHWHSSYKTHFRVLFVRGSHPPHPPPCCPCTTPCPPALGGETVVLAQLPCMYKRLCTLPGQHDTNAPPLILCSRPCYEFLPTGSIAGWRARARLRSPCCLCLRVTFGQVCKPGACFTLL